MHFHSLDYMLFLALAVTGWWALERSPRARLVFALVASWVFYMAWNAVYVVLIVASTALDYAVGLCLSRTRDPRARRAWLMTSIVGNLGMLGVFKYYNFFVTAVGDGLGLVGIHVAPHLLDVLLPVGISFYTFQSLSYTIDVYRGRLEAERSFVRFALFVAFFPQLVAGPIVRASELLPQLREPPQLDRQLVSEGLFLIAVGLVKKMVVADYLAVSLVDRVFDDPSAYTSAEVLIALYAYTLQMYCDFSGYTDVARGSAMQLGLLLPENFNRPYQATSPADFWRRWHMTLSTWLRDYLYFPLGGSKVPPARAYFNLGLTMFLIGLWHGASWNFVIYGSLHALAMVGHRFLSRRARRTPDQLDPPWLHGAKIVGTLHFTVLSRVFFRAADLRNALALGARLGQGSLRTGHVPLNVWIVLVLGYAAHFSPRRWYETLRDRFMALPASGQGLVLAVVGSILATFATSEAVPYIYFQF